jgi:hypothetical protein
MNYSGVYGIDYAKGATHITAMTSNWEGNTLAGHQYDAGTIIYGVFTSITLQNGHCVAYRL